MSEVQSTTNARVEASIHAFQFHCQEFFSWRRDSGEPFDEGLYREAMEMVIGKLKGLESKGEAAA